MKFYSQMSFVKLTFFEFYKPGTVKQFYFLLIILKRDNKFYLLSTELENYIYYTYSMCLYSLNSSWIARSRAEDWAAEKIQEGRRLRSTEPDRFLVPAPETSEWTRGLFSKTNLYPLITKTRPPTHRRVGRDRESMDRFLDALRGHAAEVPVMTGSDSFNPIMVPVLDYLRADSEREDAWSYPSRDALLTMQRRRGLSWDLRKQVIVKEITIGVTPDVEAEEIIRWAWDCYRKDQEIFPTSVLSYDVEEVKMTYMDFFALGGVRDEEKQEVVISRELREGEVYLGVKDAWYQCPVRQMYGNGTSWSLQLRIPVEERIMAGKDGKKSYRKVMQARPRVQPAVLEFVKNSPTLIGVGVRTDVTGSEECYSMLSGSKVLLPKFVDIGSLATVLGWDLGSTGMPAIALVTTGLLMNKLCSEGDTMWGLPWGRIAPSLQTYALGDLKMGHESYLVLAACAARDLFPDKEAVCLLGKTTEYPFLDWVSRYLKETLSGLELYQGAQGVGRGRIERLSVLRFRDKDGIVSSKPPERVAVLQKLLGEWPSLTRGGPRYLHQVRLKLLEQFSVLKETPGAQREDFFTHIPPPISMVKSVLFARTDLEGLDWSIPETGRGFGLVLHPDHRSTFACLDLEKLIRPGAVMQLHRLVGHKPVKERLQEWIRIQPEGWRQLVALLERRPDYVSVFSQVYEPLRLTYVRTTGDLDVTLESIENDISRGNVVLEAQLEDSFAAAEAELEMRRNRLEQFRALKAQGPYICRRGWSHVIQSTTTRPVHYVPRDRPLVVLGKRKRGADPTVRRKKARVEADPQELARKQLILTPTVTSRPDVDPEVPLDPREHESCGKVVGKATRQKRARQAVTEHSYRLVVYASSDTEEDDACNARSGPTPTSAAREQRELTGSQRLVMLDDYTSVVIGEPNDDVDLELEVSPEDTDF